MASKIDIQEYLRYFIPALLKLIGGITFTDLDELRYNWPQVLANVTEAVKGQVVKPKVQKKRVQNWEQKDDGWKNGWKDQKDWKRQKTDWSDWKDTQGKTDFVKSKVGDFPDMTETTEQAMLDFR